MNRILTRLFALLVLCGGSAYAQTWVKVANEGDAVLPSASVTVRYGSPTCNCWTQFTTSALISASNASFGDPAVGVVKELDVLETSSPQTVVVSGITLTVPALPAITGALATSQPSSVTTADKTIPVTIPKQTFTCTVPKTGPATCTIPPMTINLTIPGQTADVKDGPKTYKFTATIPLLPDETYDKSNVTITAVPQ